MNRSQIRFVKSRTALQKGKRKQDVSMKRIYGKIPWHGCADRCCRLIIKSQLIIHGNTIYEKSS